MSTKIKMICPSKSDMCVQEFLCTHSVLHEYDPDNFIGCNGFCDDKIVKCIPFLEDFLTEKEMVI